jgi:CubicO group peptidase (beta-lactamase class C family)
MAAPAGKRVIYSDLGFMILNWVVETVTENRLDAFVTEEIYQPLNIKHLFFIDVEVRSKFVKDHFAATEQCPWRKCLIEGVVHDDNAYAAGGIEGHAGLFGTAWDVYLLLSSLMKTYHGDAPMDMFGAVFEGVFDQKLVRCFFEKQKVADRALGFDMPSHLNSSSGTYFSPRTVGHLGFTGTSFWMDLDRSMMVILLTNRIHPSRTNEKIKTFRPQLHDAVWKHVREEIE